MEKPQHAPHSLDLSNSPSGEQSSQGADGTRVPNPFLGINFKCCRTYGRVYRNPQRTAYVGFCPKCAAKIKIPIGGGGSSQRFFSAE